MSLAAESQAECFLKIYSWQLWLFKETLEFVIVDSYAVRRSNTEITRTLLPVFPVMFLKNMGQKYQHEPLRYPPESHPLSACHPEARAAVSPLSVAAKSSDSQIQNVSVFTWIFIILVQFQHTVLCKIGDPCVEVNFFKQLGMTLCF